MANIHFDARFTDDERRALLYAGDLFVLPPVPSSLELVEFARRFLADAFSPLDPERAQYDMSVDDYAALLASLKPEFIHHPECKRLLPAILVELGCNPDTTYFDVPRLRTSTSDNYLTTGIAYAFHPHRDTWYSAPMCQLNWWLPVFPLAYDNGMAFHPEYWARAVDNSSEIYNYQRWTRESRFTAASHVGRDTRPQPKALEPVRLEPDIRLLPPPGGVIVFSAAQLHSSIQNTSGRTRFSIDFRTVNIDDAVRGTGAPNLDSRCTGTTMNDYLRCSDLQHVDDALVQSYMAGQPAPVGSIGDSSAR